MRIREVSGKCNAVMEGSWKVQGSFREYHRIREDNSSSDDSSPDNSIPDKSSQDKSSQYIR